MTSQYEVLRTLKELGRPVLATDVSEKMGAGPWQMSALYSSLRDLERHSLARRIPIHKRLRPSNKPWFLWEAA